MPQAEVHYLIFIQASPEQVWAGLTQPEFTRQYWLHENRSEWKTGATWEHVSTGDDTRVDIDGKVTACEPGVQLGLTWHAPGSDEPASHVLIDLAVQEGWPGGPWTEVRFAHTELIEDSEMHRSVRWGWPAVFSGLKTLLECGKFG